MSLVKKINTFFKTAIKSDIDNIKSQIVFTDRQENIFEMFYIKGQPIGYIADTLCVCTVVIDKELQLIRQKLNRIL